MKDNVCTCTRKDNNVMHCAFVVEFVWVFAEDKQAFIFFYFFYEVLLFIGGENLRVC